MHLLGDKLARKVEAPCARGLAGHAWSVTHGDPPDALRTYKVASRDEWIAAGISPRRLRTLVRAGELVRIRFGAYATAEAFEAAKSTAAQAHALQAVAAIAHADRRTYVASHESAALIHGLSLLKTPPDLVTVTRRPGTSGGRTRRSAGLSIYVAQLPDAHVTMADGIRVTTPARTVADLARSLPFMDAVVVADCAIHKVKTSKAQVRRVLQQCERWPGVAAARNVIDFGNGLSESVLESCGRVRFHEHGLPEPKLQAEFFDEYGAVIARADFFWPEHKTVAEADGMLKYTDSGVLRNQFKRDRALRERGYKVVHFTWQELFAEPRRVIASIREAFAAPSSW